MLKVYFKGKLKKRPVKPIKILTKILSDIGLEGLRLLSHWDISGEGRE